MASTPPRSPSHSRRRSNHKPPSILSITPLQPQYPLEPTSSDPHANLSPTMPSSSHAPPSPSPHAPSSYLHTPHYSPAHDTFPPSILSYQTSQQSSRATSRSASRSRVARRKIRSALALTELDTALSQHSSSGLDVSNISIPVVARSRTGTLSAASEHRNRPVLPHRRSASASTTPNKGKLVLHSRSRDEESWLTHAASTLSMQTAESKGQLWLSARSASTSLAGTPAVEREEFDFMTVDNKGKKGLQERRWVESRRGSAGGSKIGSRRGSFAASKKGSRVNLMTPMGIRTPGEADEEEGIKRMRGDYFWRGEGSGREVKFVDEARAEWEEESEEGEEDVEAEELELRKLIWGRVGGWVDWAVGWMDWRDGLEGVLVEDAEEDTGVGGDAVEAHEEGRPAGKDNDRDTGAKRREKTIKYADTAGMEEKGARAKGAVPPAPEGERLAGLLGDTRWLLGLARKALV